MTSTNPPKLKYAKGRNKQKNKFQQSSQEKIYIDLESSTDIFAHLNQDNLNYIKKELKHKKATNLSVHERAKSNTVEKLGNNGAQNHSLSSNMKEQESKQQKIYEKYKNKNQVSERDPTEEQTLRETEIDEENFSDQRSMEEKIYSHNDSPKSNYNGLKPPPSTKQSYDLYSTQNQNQNKKNKKKSIPSTESQNLKTLELETGKIDEQPFKNEMDYEMQSEMSNKNPFKSFASVENHLNETNQVPETSSFIDFLQVYIEEMRRSRRKVSEKNLNIARQTQSQENWQNLMTYRNKDQSMKRQAAYYSERYSSSNQQKIRQFNPNSTLTNLNKLSGEKSKNSSSEFQKKPKHYYLPKEELYRKVKIECYETEDKEDFFELLKKFEEEKQCCRILAAELQIYKNKVEKYDLKFSNMKKTIELLVEETEMLKSELKNESLTRRRQNNSKQKQIEQRLLKEKNHLRQIQDSKFSAEIDFPPMTSYPEVGRNIYYQTKKSCENGKLDYYKQKSKRLSLQETVPVMESIQNLQKNANKSTNKQQKEANFQKVKDKSKLSLDKTPEKYRNPKNKEFKLSKENLKENKQKIISYHRDHESRSKYKYF